MPTMLPHNDDRGEPRKVRDETAAPDETDGAAQAIHCSAKLTAIPFDILYGNHLDTGLVDQFRHRCRPLRIFDLHTGSGKPNFVNGLLT